VRAAALALLASMTNAGCCLAPIDWSSIDLEETPVELGTATFPTGTPEASARREVWRAPAITPSRYAVGYALSAEEQTANTDAFHAWARSIGYREVGGGAVVYQPRPGCENGLVCAQRFLATRDRADVQPLAARFLARGQAAHMDVIGLASLVLSFVQEISYAIPTGEPFEVIGPATVAAQGRGDCDSKSLLAVVLMQEVGIDAVLIESQAHRHGAVGIGVPSSGTTFQYQGHTYAYGESTASGWPIGRAPPEMMRPPNDWTVEVISREAARDEGEAPREPQRGRATPAHHRSRHRAR
jgi:hypothetical protein